MRFTINAGIEYVQGWIVSLEQRLGLWRHKYIAERGYIRDSFGLDPRGACSNRYEIKYRTIKVVDGEETLVYGWFRHTAIAFDLLPLAADRTEVDVQFSQSRELEPLFADVLAELHRAYPETTPATTPAEDAPLPTYRPPGRRPDPWNQAAIDRLRKGDPVAEVRAEWRAAYKEGTGSAPDEKAWQKRVWRPYLKLTGPK